MSAEPALSPREEWLLFCWMSRHPRALLEDTQAAGPSVRRPSVAYALGVAVGTLWLLVRRWW